MSAAAFYSINTLPPIPVAWDKRIGTYGPYQESDLQLMALNAGGFSRFDYLILEGSRLNEYSRLRLKISHRNNYGSCYLQEVEPFNRETVGNTPPTTLGTISSIYDITADEVGDWIDLNMKSFLRNYNGKTLYLRLHGTPDFRSYFHSSNSDYPPILIP